MRSTPAERRARYRQARRFFRRLYPTLGDFRLSKLVALAMAYSVRPDWYA